MRMDGEFADVFAKPEDGGAYKAYWRYRHLRRVLSCEPQMVKVRRYLAPPRGD